MFYDQLATAIECASLQDLHSLSQQLWKAHGAGGLDDAQAQALAETMAARRNGIKQATSLASAARAPLKFAKSAPQRSPDKARSIGRRRQLAASGVMSPAMAANFTVSELAALKVISDEVMMRGCCDRSIAEIAARAGVGASTVRNAVRFAKLSGLLTVLERPRAGRKNLTNLIRIISAEWRTWLRLRPVRSGIGFKNVKTTATDLETPVAYRDKTGVWRPKGKGNRATPGRRRL
jgi:hypothetical protein